MHCKDSEVWVTLCRDTHSVHETLDGVTKELSDGDDGAAHEEDEGRDSAVQPEHHIVQPEAGEVEVVLQGPQYAPDGGQSNLSSLLVRHYFQWVNM